ncbi:MAG: M48 family metalloprotease [Actinomycetes bacterium]
MAAAAPAEAPDRHDRVVPSAALAAALALAGVVATLARPLAPDLPAVPTDLDAFDPAVLATVAAYTGPRYLGIAVATLLDVLVPVLLLALPAGRRAVARLSGSADARGWRRAARGALVAVLAVGLTRLAILPIAFALGFVQDGRWGFRTAGLGTWFADWALAAGTPVLVAAAAGAVVVTALHRWPRSWPYRLTVAATVLAAVLVLLDPLVLQPLRLTTTPLPAGPTRTAVETVLERAGEGDLEVLVGDASRRTTRVNAFVTGLGPSRRVVVYDTLLELGPDEVAAVVAHELAHREHRDIPRGVLATATGVLPALLVLSRLLAGRRVRGLVDARGPADPRLVAVVAAVAAVATLVGQPVVTWTSRRVEAAADARGLELSGAATPPIATARTFVVRDLADPTPPTWAVWLRGSHPTADARIRATVDLATHLGLELPDLDELRRAEAERRHPAIPGDAP